MSRHGAAGILFNVSFNISAALLFSTACSREPQRPQPQASAPHQTPSVRVFVTNETSGDLTIIDAATQSVVATAPLGKRPRGIKASPDGRSLFVALSGSPMGGPGVERNALPPADRSADGIGERAAATYRVK